MSTDSRRSRSRRRRGRGFRLAFAAVLGALVLVAGVGAAVAVAQGPRLTDVQADPRAAVEASGSRVILTTTQSLREVDAAQVEVDPVTPFTVDTSGRSIGVRFTHPLADDTRYTVRVRDVRGLGAGPAATLESAFRTPPLELYLLQRESGEGADTIYRTDLSGDAASAVFSHPHIEDYRATATHLVVSAMEADTAVLLVVDPTTGADRALPLPGNGFVSALQSADRGDRIGYTYSDASLSAESGRESVLFTASLADAAADESPEEVALPGDDVRVADWRFVPDTDRILALTFDGRLLLAGPDGSDAAPLGSALAIEGIARGSTEAIVERNEGMAVLDLSDGSETPLAAATDDIGLFGTVTPVPGDRAGTIRAAAAISDAGALVSNSVVHVSDDGTVSPLLTLDRADALVQTCVSPSGRYAAVVLAPDAAENAYDRYRLPLPERLETRVIEIRTADEAAGLGGYGPSWCQAPPS